MSHDLLTPLNSLADPVHLLADNPQAISTKSDRSSPHITRAGSDLLNLINDILDLSKIESGPFRSPWRHFDVG